MTEKTETIDVLNPETVDQHLAGLAAVLNASVLAGASVSFVLPHTMDDSLAFWRDSVRPAVVDGSRAVLVAVSDGVVVGTVQLDCATPPNQPHRADVAKMLVHPDHRSRGIARRLMEALEDEARRRGRWLLALDTANDHAEALYASLGYEKVGAIPDYACDPVDPARFDATVIMYKRLP